MRDTGRIQAVMEGSSIKSTFRDYVRVIFQRKKFILIPAIGIPLCLAIYAFGIAEEIYRAENRIVVLDNKTNKPLLGNLSTTSDLVKRINTSVERITSRNGILNIIAGIDYVAAKFPDSGLIQNKRRDVLIEKRTVLEYRLSRVNGRILRLEAQLDGAGDASQEKRCLAWNREDLLRDRRLCEAQTEELQKKIRHADERILAIARKEAEFQHLIERSEKEPGNAELRLLCEAGEKCELDEQARLGKLVDDFLNGLKIGIRGNSVSVSFESRDPQLCKDIVDETLLRLEFENLSIKKQEVLSTTEILDDKIREYERRVAEKENMLEGYDTLHILDAYPGELDSGEFDAALRHETAMMRVDVSAPHIIKQYRGYLKELQDIRRQISELSARRSVMTEQIGDTPEFIEGCVVESIPEHVTRLKNELHSAEMERVTLLQTMTESHPFVQKVSESITRLKDMLAETDKLEVTQVERVKNPRYSEIQAQLGRIDREIAGLKAREAETSKQMESYRQKARELPGIRNERNNLAGALAADGNMLRNLQQRKSGAEITRALEVDSEQGMKFERPDPTSTPLVPISPNRRVLMLLGLLLGGATAAVLLFFVEYADRSIRGIADVKRHLGLPVLGTVPHFFRKDKGIKARRVFSARRALNYALTTAVVTVLVISFIFDSEVSEFVGRQLGRETPVAGLRKYQGFPNILAEWSAWDTLTETAETAPGPAVARPPAVPEIDIEPGVYAAEESP